MALKFLQETHEDVLTKIKSDLSFIDPEIDLDEFQGMTQSKLRKELETVRESITALKTGTYGSWLRDEAYVRNTLLEEALRTMIDDKQGQMRRERLTPGASYYTGVSRYGDVLEGHYSIYLGEAFTGWMEFRESTAVAKAMTVLRFGSQDDFREIYVGLADGNPDALNDISIGHITESSDEALKLIEEYCDSRWDGPWPWEIEAPEKLKHMIESREEKNMNSIMEMQERFGKLLREFEEGQMNQFEMVSAAQEMMGRVDSMISDLGKLSSNGIEVMAQAKASGDESLVEPMQQALGEPLNAAVSALTDLKAALAGSVGELTGSGGGAPSPDMGDDMGTPADAMGADPMGGDADALADVDIAGDSEERAMKDM